MNRPPLGGLWLVKLPVRDLDRSLTWYRQVFAVVTEMEFRDEHGVLQGVTCSLPGIADTRIAFRQDPQAAEGYAGFDPVAWHVVDLSALERWAHFLDQLGIAHSPVIVGTEVWLMIFRDPDDIGHHLYTRSTHGLDTSDRPGAGRRLNGATGDPDPR